MMGRESSHHDFRAAKTRRSLTLACLVPRPRYLASVRVQEMGKTLAMQCRSVERVYNELTYLQDIFSLGFIGG